MPNYKSQNLLTGGVIASTTAPVAHIGQRWFNTATGVTYQYTIDAAGTTFWLDISSGGIGTSAARGIDFVGDIDPHKATNGSGLAVGSVYYNRENNRHFVCTDATGGANVWSGRYSGAGGTVTDYLLSSTYYRVHSFLSSGTFTMEDTTSCDILVVAGGGNGGGAVGGDGGGGGAGGLVANAGVSVAKGTYAVTVGDGGGIGGASTSARGYRGSNSVLAGLYTAYGGGGGLTGNVARDAEADGGSGGGSGSNGTVGNTPGNASPGGQGNVGGGTSGWEGSGGGGAGAAGTTNASGSAAPGGVGLANAYRTGSDVFYAGGGGGGGDTGIGAGGNGGGGAGSGEGSNGTDGTANTGGGGGGNGGSQNGGAGGSGIVVIRYAL